MSDTDKLEFVKLLFINQATKKSDRRIGLEIPHSSVLYKENQNNEHFFIQGVNLLKQGKIGIVMVAGGLSTRMGLPRLRGNMILGPVTKTTIFQFQMEKIVAIRRYYCEELVLIILTSPQVHNETIKSFSEKDFFGMPKDQIHFIAQQSFPVLDTNLQPVRNDMGELLEFPNGHGGLINAFQEHGILEKLEKNGIEHLFYFQYPNVLEQVCDPVAIGYHVQQKSEFTTKAISDYQRSEKLGKISQVQESYKVIEYYDKESINSDYWDKLPANLATHIISVSFLRKFIQLNCELPYHILPLHSHDNIFKAEQFIFDLMEYANSQSLIIVSRPQEYSCVKTKVGVNSLKQAKIDVSNRNKNWLGEIGYKNYNKIDENALVEISPLFALDIHELRQKREADIMSNVLIST